MFWFWSSKLIPPRKASFWPEIWLCHGVILLIWLNIITKLLLTADCKVHCFEESSLESSTSPKLKYKIKVQAEEKWIIKSQGGGWCKKEGSIWFLWWCNWADPDYQGLNSDFPDTDYFFPLWCQEFIYCIVTFCLLWENFKKVLGNLQVSTQVWCSEHCQTRQTTGTATIPKCNNIFFDQNSFFQL